MKEANIIEKILLTFLVITTFFIIITIYNLGYSALFKTDYSYMFGYTTYKVNETNYSPEFKINDVLVLKKQSGYAENDIIVFKEDGTPKIAKIDGFDAGSYKASDKLNKEYYTDDSNVIGKYVINLHWFSIIYKIMTSPYIFLLIIILLGAYFLVSMNEKNS